MNRFAAENPDLTDFTHDAIADVLLDSMRRVALRYPTAPFADVEEIALEEQAEREVPRGPVSGDLCRFINWPGLSYPAVEHYRCDDYRDGCVTDPVHGHVLKHNVGTQRGFERNES